MAENYVPEVESWVAENYEALIADKDRGLTYKKVADEAEKSGDENLAAWARSRAAGKGADVTPVEAESAPKKVTRISQKKDGTEVEVQVDTVDPAVGAEELDDEGHPIVKKSEKK